MRPQPATRHLLQIGSASIAGMRKENQDRVAGFDSPFGQVFLLADGMGGYRGGAVASRLATSRLPELICSFPADTMPETALVESIRELNLVMLAESRSGAGDGQGMGSTLVALLVRHTPDGSLAIGAHVGDSRMYFLRGSRMFCLTRDHTVVQQLVESGALTPEQAEDHPQASVLTRALGRGETLSVDLTSWMLLQPRDTFLLCSDGLSGYADDMAIQQILSDPDLPDVVARRLIDLALREQSRDNISALIVRVSN